MSAWGKLVGLTGGEAKARILQKEPNMNVQILSKNSPTTRDYRTNRVRIFVDQANRVVREPFRG